MKRILPLIAWFIISICSQLFSQIDTLSFDLIGNNFNQDLISQIDDEISNNQYGKMHSLLIIRNGDLVFENYYNGYERNQLHPLYSVTKTFTSALLGIAIDQEKVKSVDDSILDYFPEYVSINNNDSLKKAVTIKHLLTMTAGFGSEDSLWLSENYLDFMVNIPMENEPGSMWKYSSGSSVLLSGILQNQTGTSAEDFAASYLFEPLGIANWFWNKNDQGLTGTSGGLHLRPIDAAKFGQLYLQKGGWNSHQVISKDWIEESTKVHVDFTSHDRSYGYHLYQLVPSSNVIQSLAKNDIYLASGAKNQKIYIIPHLKSVIVMTGDGADADAILTKLLLAFGEDSSTATHDAQIQSGDISLICHPNPFKDSTTIQFKLGTSANVRVEIYNVVGKVVEVLVDSMYAPGKHEVIWDTKNLRGGIYFCKMQANNITKTIQLVLE